MYTLFFDMWWKRISIALILVLREFGVFNLALYTSIITPSLPMRTITVPTREVTTSITGLNMPVSVLDYVPFYKMRTFKGTITVTVNQEVFTFPYSMNVAAMGLCPGSLFRRIASQHIQDRIKIQLAPQTMQGGIAAHLPAA